MMLRHHAETLPGFVRGAAVVRAALGALRPPERATVAEVAERIRVLKNPGGGYSGPWRNAMAPQLVEPMEALTRRDVLEVCILGPAQFGKTEIILNVAVYQAAAGGADVLIFQPSQALAQDFAERRLAKAFSASPELAALLGEGRGDDKLLSKAARNGARISVGWPVSAQLSSRPVPVVVLDELDSMPDDIGGEGDPVSLARQRTTTFGRQAKVLVASTPKRQDGSGIVARWRAGDRRLWHWPCAGCGEYFTPGFDGSRRPTLAHLHVRPDATEEEARAEAALSCPHNGCVLVESQKAAMNARGLWLPEGATITPDGVVGGAPVRSATRSYWWSGMASRGRSWADLAAEYVAALREVEQRQDETKLRAFWNASIGAPYRSLVRAAATLEPEQLQARAEEIPLRQVPEWAGFVTAAADVQGDRFDCLAVAWGPGGRSQVIDAWQVLTATDEGGAQRRMDPARRREDWDRLTAELLLRTWPGAGGAEFRAAQVVVDTGGADGVTGNAYDWWHGLRLEHPQLVRRVMLAKGTGNRDAPLLNLRRIEQDAAGKRLKRGIALCLLNVEALKDQIDLRLRMRSFGPGWLHLPRSLPDRFWQEATAEARGPKGWEKLRARNEAFDLLVYNLAAWHRRGGPRLDWAHPAEWHRPRVAGLVADLRMVAAAVDAAPAPQPAAPARVPVPGRSRFWKAPAMPGARSAARF